MFIYLVMAFWSALALGFNTRLSAMMAQSLAPTGALMTFIALWTGSLWGRPTWGTYWAWDARMTSELILLFLYLGVIALRNAIDDPRRADRACAVLSLVGAINIPIIYFSVKWWNTLHQGSSVSLSAAPKMATIMLTGMLDHVVRRMVLRDRRVARSRARDHRRARARRRLGRRIAGGARSMSEFFAMGGYAFYVWGAYGVTALVIVIEVLAVRARRARSARGGAARRAREPDRP